jgi:hypothetical protein
MSLATILAINWEPELRGITTVLIGFVVLCGSIYLINGTNLGSRLGFLVSFAGLAGWMSMMGLIWMIYGIGLNGRTPTWKPVEVVRDGNLVNAGIAGTNDFPIEAGGPKTEGWIRLADENPGRGQAVASADEILQRELEVFAAGQYEAVAVYDKGGERYPKVTIDLPGPHAAEFDFLAFKHKPHYALVRVQPLIPVLDEPGRAPTKAAQDPDAPPTYVLMIRDLGTRRQPAIFLFFGGGLIFGILCWMLHRRDRIWDANRNGKALEPSAAGA